MIYNDVVNILKKNGYKDNINISDYWFENKDKFIRILKEYHPTISQIFDLQVRWKSEIGQVCQQAIRNEIEYVSEKYRQDYLYNSLGPLAFPQRPELDFSKFQFIYKGQDYSIQEFTFKLNTTHTLQGPTDIQGIDLSGISLDNCKIINCNFALSCFDKSSIFQLELVNCNFVRASFVNARFSSVRMDEYSTFGGAIMTNAFINAVSFNDKNFRDVIYKRISYFNLILLLVSKSFHFNFMNSGKHNLKLKYTDFQYINTSNFNNFENKDLKRYVEWYMYVNKCINNLSELGFIDRVIFIFNVFFTKYWTSFKVLTLNACLIILFYSSIFHYNIDNLLINTAIKKNFFTSLYYSVTTFSSFGFGDIIPKTNLMQFAIMTEIILGYYILGIFVILLTKKLDTKY
ncbi:MAG: ion channel [Bacteroidota bacterium]